VYHQMNESLQTPVFYHNPLLKILK
jgi:hypothetical protein